LADFCQTGIFAGFSLYIERKKERKKERSHLIINNAVRISEALMGGAGDIILIKKNITKIVRTYGRTGIYMNFDPKCIKKGRIRRRRIAPTRRIRRDKKR
jgi:hypothetical protein